MTKSETCQNSAAITKIMILHLNGLLSFVQGQSGPFDVDFSKGFSELNPSGTAANKTAEKLIINTTSSEPVPQTVTDKSGDNMTEPEENIKAASLQQDKVEEMSTTSIIVEPPNVEVPENKDELAAELGATSTDVITDVSRGLDVNDPFGCVTPDPDDPFNAEPDPFTVTTNKLTAEKPQDVKTKDDDPFNLAISVKAKADVVADTSSGINVETDDNTRKSPTIVANVTDPFATPEPGNADTPDKTDPFDSFTVFSETPKAYSKDIQSPKNSLTSEKPEVTDDLKSSDPFADSDPFSSSDPFAGDPFGNDPFSNQSDPFSNQSDPFASQSDPFDSKQDPFNEDNLFGKDDPFAVDKTSGVSADDPFADVDPFASSISSVKSLKVDSDPFGDSWASFPNNKIEVTGEQNNELPKLTVEKTSEPNLTDQPVATSNVSMTLNFTNTGKENHTDVPPKPEDAAHIDMRKSVDSNQDMSESDDDQLTSAPPSCPPPTLPAEVLSSVNKDSLSTPAVTQQPMRKPPPAIPARRPVTVPAAVSASTAVSASAAASVPANLPPVPSRSRVGRAQSQLDAPVTAVTAVTVSSNAKSPSSDSTQPPALPPPTLPPPKSKPPTVPNRSVSVPEPPKLPERPKRAMSAVDENLSVIGSKSIPLSLPPRHFEHSDV